MLQPLASFPSVKSVYGRRGRPSVASGDSRCYKGHAGGDASHAALEHWIMKNLSWILYLGLLLVCGCTHQYVMKLGNGTRVTTASKPQLKGSNYYFKDATGQINAIPQT